MASHIACATHCPASAKRPGNPLTESHREFGKVLKNSHASENTCFSPSQASEKTCFSPSHACEKMPKRTLESNEMLYIDVADWLVFIPARPACMAFKSATVVSKIA